MSSSNTKNPKAAREGCYYVVETPRSDSYIIARVFYAREHLEQRQSGGNHCVERPVQFNPSTPSVEGEWKL